METEKKQPGITPHTVLQGIAWGAIVLSLIAGTIQFGRHGGEDVSSIFTWANFKAPVLIFVTGFVIRILAEIVGSLQKIAERS